MVLGGRMPCCRAHVLPVLSARCSTLKERVSRRLCTFLTHAPGRHLCEGWRLALPQISPYEICYLFHILQIDSPEPTGFEPAIFCVTGRHVRPLHHGSSFVSHRTLF